MKIQDLLQTPDKNRDSKWEDLFLQELSDSQLTVINPDPQQGPDSWPYLLAETNEGSTESAQKILHWLSTKGIGLVINPLKDYPDFILTYGMIWNFRETGRFINRNHNLAEQNLTQDSTSLDLLIDSEVEFGPATEQFLPIYVRQILKDFFRDQGLYSIKYLVLGNIKNGYDLVFTTESLGNPPEKEWNGIAEAISWFLPLHYSIVIASEKNLPKTWDF